MQIIATVLTLTALLWAGDAPAAPGDCGYYINSYGREVPRPCGDARTERTPRGATAICRDGTFSFSQHPYSGGTCSYHGGVIRYLR